MSKRRNARSTAGPMVRSSGPTLANPERRAEILRRIRALAPGSARRWGRMTVGQMVCHLADSNRMALGDLQVAPGRVPIPGVIVKWVGLYTPLPWPSGLPTSRELDPQAQGTTPTELSADVAVLEGTIERLAASVHRTEWPPHPLFGAMSANDWLRWAYLHMDHHLRQFGV